MSINVVFKKSMMLLLFTFTIILFLFSTSSRVHAMNEPNLALNPSGTGFPEASASFTCCSDSVWHAVDGSYSADRWTNWSSPTQNGTDSFTIDFGSDSAKAFNQVKLYIYNDGGNGGVQPPASYTIQYWDGHNWIDTTHQTKTPETPEAALYPGATTASILNTVDFDTVTSTQLQVIFTNNLNNSSGIVEIEVYSHSLVSTIAAANVMNNAAVEGTLVGQYSSGAKAALAAAIEASRVIADGTNVGQTTLDAAEAALNSAISTFESSVVPLVSFYSAFGNTAGDVITLYVSNTLDTSYHLDAANFIVIDGSNVPSTISSVSQNGLDNTISLTLTAPLSGEIASLHVKLLKDAFKTNQGDLSSRMDNIPIIQADQLDLNVDQRIGIDDLILLQTSNSPLKDINQDGTIFDNADIQILLKQIMPMFAS
jgi:hypothetical protein